MRLRSRQRRAALGLVVVALTACTSSAQPGPRQPSPTAACGPVRRPPVQVFGHLVGDAEPPVPYSSTPPTSGWHASGVPSIAPRPPGRPLSEPEQVSVLEAGGVVVTHRGLAAAGRRALHRLAERRYPGRVAVTAYDELAPGRVVMAGWGALQRCDGVDLGAVAAFADAHADEHPSAH
ncbi:MAG: DUF3105 domain-containing protein [Actinobacteria bacterium]|nr:DUF3105 domain-containing protein [Actinomycetota bacterium]